MTTDASSAANRNGICEFPLDRDVVVARELEEVVRSLYSHVRFAIISLKGFNNVRFQSLTEETSKRSQTEEAPEAKISSSIADASRSAARSAQCVDGSE